MSLHYSVGSAGPLLLTTVLPALFSGVLASLLVQAFYLPRRVRRNAAALLAIELRANASHMADTYVRMVDHLRQQEITSTSAPPFERSAYTAVGEHIMELSPAVAIQVLRAYQLQLVLVSDHGVMDRDFERTAAARTTIDAGAAQNYFAAARAFAANAWTYLYAVAELYPRLTKVAGRKMPIAPAVPPPPDWWPEGKAEKLRARWT